MRLFPPLTHLAKQTNSTHDVTITTSTRTYLIPRRTIIYINTVSLHLSPTIYGPDAAQFKPSRWLIDPSLPPTSSSSTIANLKTMPKGTFLPWSSGPRACPGMKMSQVEFVGVFLTIFARYRCEAVKVRGDETPDEIRARITAIMADSQPKLTLQMMRNRDLKLRWVKR